MSEQITMLDEPLTSEKSWKEMSWNEIIEIFRRFNEYHGVVWDPRDDGRYNVLLQGAFTELQKVIKYQDIQDSLLDILKRVNLWYTEKVCIIELTRGNNDPAKEELIAYTNDKYARKNKLISIKLKKVEEKLNSIPKEPIFAFLDYLYRR
jgi:hypothetical protein